MMRLVIFLRSPVDPFSSAIAFSASGLPSGLSINPSDGIISETIGSRVQCLDNLATIEIFFSLPPLAAIVTEPGIYSLDIHWQGEIIGSHRLVAEDASQQSKGVEDVVSP